MSELSFDFKLTYTDGTQHVFPIRFNKKTLEIIQEPKESYPEWAKLSCRKCANCPLDEEKHPYCPIAIKISDIIDYFCQPHPSKEVNVNIQTPERTYSKRVDIRTAASSLLGIYMATSGCPIMDKLKPMARFHLPFATADETTYRTLTNYLVAQYLLVRQGKEADWKFVHLKPMYNDIATVNTHFQQRLMEGNTQNCALNALLQLNSFAFYIKMSLTGEAFLSVEHLFNKEFQEEDLLDPDKKPKTSGEKIDFQYQFKFQDEISKEFTLSLDKETLHPLSPPKDGFPTWTALSCEQCPNCPLDKAKFKHCPAATGIAEAIEFFKDIESTHPAHITVKTAERDLSADKTATAGISAMMGLVMATSGCPILGRLKPLAYHHLPFASNNETVYRSLGMYLLSQYFAMKDGKTPDWELKDFTKLYEEINVVNKAFCNRLRQAGDEDANLNALIKLDCFAQQITMTISEGYLKDLEKLFQAYLE